MEGKCFVSIWLKSGYAFPILSLFLLVQLDVCIQDDLGSWILTMENLFQMDFLMTSVEMETFC